MKYLKTYEELSPEYLNKKAGDRDTPQKERIGAAADKMINKRNEEEAYKKRQAEEEERLKDPIYKQNKELDSKRYSLASQFRDEKLNFYFTTEGNEGCFLNRVEFIIGRLADDYYDFYYFHMGLEEPVDEKDQPFISVIRPDDELSGYWGSDNERVSRDTSLGTIDGWKGDDSRFDIMINKDGIIVLKNTIESMKKFHGQHYDSYTDYEEGRFKKFEGVKLVGMDLASKNKLANFIKQYIPEATCGPGKLQINGIEMPVLDKHFTQKKCKPLELKSDI